MREPEQCRHVIAYEIFLGDSVALGIDVRGVDERWQVRLPMELDEAPASYPVGLANEREPTMHDVWQHVRRRTQQIAYVVTARVARRVPDRRP